MKNRFPFFYPPPQQFDSAERSAVLISVINAFIPVSHTAHQSGKQQQPASCIIAERNTFTHVYEIKPSVYVPVRENPSARHQADKNIWALREIVMRAEWRRNYTAQWLLRALIDGLIEPPLSAEWIYVSTAAPI
jgi:hypothetical protein